MTMRLPRVSAVGLALTSGAMALSLLSSVPASASPPVAAKPLVSTIRPAGHSLRTSALVTIPSFGVSAKVVVEGVDKKTGQFVVPGDPKIIGWSRYGPQPGEPGTALFFGHRSSAGAFWHVPEMKRGTEFKITGLNGVVTKWRVTSVQQAPKKDLPGGLFENTGAPRVAFVTCGGEFNYKIGHFKDNVIAWAQPASK